MVRDLLTVQEEGEMQLLLITPVVPKRKVRREAEHAESPLEGSNSKPDEETMATYLGPTLTDP